MDRIIASLEKKLAAVDKSTVVSEEEVRPQPTAAPAAVSSSCFFLGGSSAGDDTTLRHFTSLSLAGLITRGQTNETTDFERLAV